MGKNKVRMLWGAFLIGAMGLAGVIPAAAQDCGQGEKWGLVRGVLEFDDDPMSIQELGSPYLINVEGGPLYPVPILPTGAYFLERGVDEKTDPLGPEFAKAMEPFLGRRIEVTGCYAPTSFGYIADVASINTVRD